LDVLSEGLPAAALKQKPKKPVKTAAQSTGALKVRRAGSARSSVSPDLVTLI
jgi:hypothetical protein